MEDLVGLIAVVMGSLIILIPVAGLTARFALKPLIEHFSRARSNALDADRMEALEARIALLEQQQELTDTELQRLGEVAEFHARLSEAGGNG